MKNTRIAILTLQLVLSAYLFAQPGTAYLTPVKSIAANEVNVEVPLKFSSLFPSSRKLTVPVGYKVRLFHIGGLTKPRFMSYDANGVLHVADQTAGKVFALPDKNNDGIADTIITAADNFSISHDVKFYKGAMYVTNERRVWKLTDTNSDGVYETRTVFIDSIAEGATQPGGGHRTRTLVFDSVNAKAYLSIGSLCNVCREEYRAVIERYNDDGTGREIFATGVRNAVGMDIQPTTRKIWANNNGSDRQGNEIPPEWIDVVRENGFYGYPFAYGNQAWFNMNAHPDYQALLPITATDSAKVNKMIQPAALIRSHTAPMALHFLNASFPDSMRYGMLSALRGSWNAPGNHRGYSVIYLHLDGPTDTVVKHVSTVVSGFLTDSVNRVFWGRPVGIATDNNGQIMISSDEGTACILQVYREIATGMSESNIGDETLSIVPNPASEFITIQTTHPIDYLKIVDTSGRLYLQATSSQIDIRTLKAGSYIILARTKCGQETFASFIKQD
ncbi:MAG: PQQ-dependent sugar dehydrogenase [Bacteroidota bacterium]|jgi:glucose/arabinose dehydrogenase